MARNVEFIPEVKLVKAMHVFWSKGYTSASLDDLTAAMKINKSSMYNTVGDKHKLFTNSLKAYGKIVEKDYAAAIKDHHSPIENIESIIEHIGAVSTDRDNSCLGVKTSFELASEDKEIQAIIRAGHEQTICLIKSLINEAQTSGQIKPERDAYAMANVIFNSSPGFVNPILFIEINRWSKRWSWN